MKYWEIKLNRLTTLLFWPQKRYGNFYVCCWRIIYGQNNIEEYEMHWDICNHKYTKKELKQLIAKILEVR